MAAFVTKSNSLPNSVNEEQLNSTVNEDEIEKTLKILEDGEKKIESSDPKQYPSVTLVLGITGSGKSAFVQWFAGDDSKLISEEKEDDEDEYIIKDDSRISNSTTESKTIIPELVVDLKTSNVFYDCPGFSDTRNASIDIAGTYFVKKVIDYAQNVRLLLLVDHPSVEEGEKRNGLTDLLKHSTNLVKDVDKYRTSLALVVTKVNNFSSGGKFKTTENIINSIGSFLLKVKGELIEKAEPNDVNAIKLLDVLLQQDKNQAYSKIGIFRKPDQAGPLSEIPLLVEGKKDIDIMVRRLKFTPTGPSDFGYAISESSRKYVDDLANQINNRVWFNLEGMVSEMTNFYNGIFRQMTNKINSFVAASDSVDANPEEAHSFVMKYNTDLRAITQLVEEVTNVATVKELAQKLNSTLITLGITTCQDGLSSISGRASNLEFLQSMSKTALSTRPWETLLKPIVNSLSTSVQLIQKDVDEVAKNVKNTVQSTFSDIAIQMWQVKLSQMKSMVIQELPTKLDQDYLLLQNMTLALNKANNTEDLATAISGNVASVGMETLQIKSNTLSIFTRARYLNFLQALSDHQLDVWSPDWKVQFNQIEKSIFIASKWYRFLGSLYSKFGEFEFQKDLRRYNGANLDNWGKGQSEAADIQIDMNNFQEFLNKLSDYNISEYDAIRNAQVAQWQLNELNQLLGVTLKNKFTHTCDGTKTLITGNYIKFSDLIENNRIKPDLCPAMVNSTENTVNIFASDKVFIDTSLDGLDTVLKITVLAPNWEIIGNNRTVKLDGSSAKAHTDAKAKDGKRPGNSGENGKPGYPGVSAGAFLGIGKQFVNVEALTITAVGGVGSDGQNGGDGKAGDNGKDALEPSKNCKISDKYDVTSSKTEQLNDWATGKISFITTTEYLIKGTEATAGGSGGHGGAYGIGGLTGNIEVFNLEDVNMYLNAMSSQGKNGTNGIAGAGQAGGKNGNNMKAECVLSTLHLLMRNEVVPVNTKASSGSNGIAGNNTQGWTSPEMACTIEYANRVNECKMYLRENLYGVYGRFKRNSIIQFVDQLDGDVRVGASYDTLALAGELQGLEEQFRTLTNKSDLVHFYQSLVARIAKYVESPKPTEKTVQHKKMFNYLYSASLGKLHNLKSGSETNLIIDVKGYLDYVEQNVKILEQLKKDDNQQKIVNEQKEKYKANIDKQIEEAKQFIETQVTPEFERISIKIDEQIDKLLAEIVELEKQAEKNRDEIIKMREKLEKQMIWKGVFGSIKVVSQVATFFGPYGMAIGAAGSVTASIGESLAMGEPVKFEIPEEVKDLKNLLTTELDKFNQENSKELKANVDEMNKQLKPVAKLNDLAEDIEEIKNNMGTGPKAIAAATDDIQKKLDEKEKQLEDSKDDSEDEKKALKIAKNIFQIGSELWGKVKEQSGKIDAASDALMKSEKELRNLDLVKKNIYNKISPSMDQLVNYLAAVQSKLDGTTSQVALDVTNWQVQSMVRDVKLEMKKATKDTTVEDDLGRCIEKLEEAMTILIKIYDRIQSLQQQQQLADFIANINSRQSNAINIQDAQLSAAVNKLDIVIRSNVVLQQYDAVVVALKQLVFPYAHHYLETLTLPAQFNFNSTDIDDLVINASEAINKMKMKILKQETTIWDVDKYSHDEEFDSLQPCSQSPFYVWSNGQHASTLFELLSGKSVTLKADIRQSDPAKDAIKFLKIELNFKTKNTSLQAELNGKLEYFMVQAIHLGNSYYRHGDKYYMINNEPQDIEYSFAKNSSGFPINSNKVYKKIAGGNLMLSPYTMWQIQLTKMKQDSNMTFGELAMYRDEIYLELAGVGSYIDSKAALIGDNLEMDRYYHEYLDDETSAQVEANVVQQYELRQMFSVAHAKKQDKCRQYMAMCKASNSLHKSDNCRTGALSYISRLGQTVSNYFGVSNSATATAPPRNHIAHSRFEYTKQHNANTNTNSMSEASNSPVDVHGNLLMAQLLVGLIAGKNNTIASSESYQSPEQTHNLVVDRLAQRVVPALSQFSATRSNQIHNSNTQWHRDWNDTSREHN